MLIPMLVSTLIPSPKGVKSLLKEAVQGDEQEVRVVAVWMGVCGWHQEGELFVGFSKGKQ